MIIGILLDAATTETLLTNFAEARFDLADGSTVMRDHKQRAALAVDAGPLAYSRDAQFNAVTDKDYYVSEHTLPAGGMPVAYNTFGTAAIT